MFVWDYETIYNTDEDVTAILSMAKFDKGKTYKIVKHCHTVEKVLFWLKHFERLDLETFKLCANVTSYVQEAEAELESGTK